MSALMIIETVLKSRGKILGARKLGRIAREQKRIERLQNCADLSLTSGRLELAFSTTKILVALVVS